jgi:hypothetical protein
MTRDACPSTMFKMIISEYSDIVANYTVNIDLDDVLIKYKLNQGLDPYGIARVDRMNKRIYMMSNMFIEYGILSECIFHFR